MVVELLQQVGLNKYEAEAYAALLQHGPLTGYELGKRSGVPLSRSYEILERLTVKGLALVQPGDPPRYIGEEPQQFLERTRSANNATLDALAGALAELGPPAVPEGFWVVRGREHILAHANACIARAERTLALQVGSAQRGALAEAIAQARARGCRIAQPTADALAKAAILLLVDEREALVGSLAPADRAQVVVSTNPGFVAILSGSLAPQRAPSPSQGLASSSAARETPGLAWLDWEQSKQRRLLDPPRENRTA
ncbi:MAG TPA: helix-turn-helix domain-containing protein [Roseiflexaceae bacterium]|nr:helix-turn-helix domain-containing protein [Roseiflexaceae bacterium]